MPSYYLRFVEPEGGKVFHAVMDFPDPMSAKRDLADRMKQPISLVAPRTTVVVVPKKFVNLHTTKHYDLATVPMEQFLARRCW
ncbi:MAG: hypothetical protein KGI60_00650 [Patescibacteria group bacterium]|nr:hypothetical protein [Patescibacteria group bacterium]